MKEQVAGIQEKLKKRSRGIRWVNPELLHLTLKFLGDIRPEDLQIFEQPLRELAEETAPFQLSFDRLGAFPDLHHPRVIWIGVRDGYDQLKHLAEKMEAIFSSRQDYQCGQRKKGKEPNIFVPHLTLGRKQRGATLFFPSEIFSEPWDCNHAVPIDRFFLMQSTLYASGPVYTPEKDFLLNASR